MKKIVVIVLSVFLLTGCFSNKTNQEDGTKRIYLTSSYYNKGEFIKVDDLTTLESDTYILFTYNNFCNLAVSCDKIFESFMKKYNIDFISIPFDKFKGTYLYETVKYAPSVIIVKDKEVVSYLDANSDEDLDKYQDETAFESYLNKYIYFKDKD